MGLGIEFYSAPELIALSSTRYAYKLPKTAALEEVNILEEREGRNNNNTNHSTITATKHNTDSEKRKITACEQGVGKFSRSRWQ